MRTYSTNELCKLCDVSRKQLRYYEERGILSSVPRDEGNNYRYYTSEHIYELVAAKALRRIDMPLSEMKDLIYGNNVGHIQLSLQQQIDSARDNMENSLRQYEQSVRVYTRLVEALSLLRLRSSGGGELPIETVDCARRDIVSLSYLIVQFLPLNYTTAVLNAVLVGWGSATYWTLLYSMCYDCGIVSMLKNGESKDGLYTSAIGFFMKFGTAVGMWIVGFGLDFIHYDPALAAQTAETLSGLRLLFTLPNGIILLVGAAVMLRYGMDKKAYTTLEAAYEKKQKGEAYDLGEYADMIR